MNKVKILLIAIIVLAGILRLYKIDSVPPSLSWDETAVGYNAWTIANWGRDEYGKLFPAFFKSFGDDKHPVHIYSTAISVKILGLSEFSTRLPSAIFGILNVILIFFLVRLMFASSNLGLIASLFLAISPYNIHFSRFNHEANFGLFFFMLGLTLFFLATTRKRLLPLSALSFGIAFISYHPSKIVVPLVVILLVLLYGKQLLKDRIGLLGVLVVAIFFFLLVLFNPQLLGIARVNQTSLNMDEVRKTRLFQLTNNEILGRLNLTLIQYSWHFMPNYLFISGDKNPRLSDQATGQFYIIEAIFLIVGVIALLYKRSKVGIVLLVWALAAPIPSALVSEAPHSARAMFMMGSWHAISAVGFFSLLNMVPKPLLKKRILITTILIMLFLLSRYLNNYYVEYARKNAIDWQYGMKQIVEYIKDNTQYSQVFTTDIRSQPYIFFLYYLKVPLTEYLSSVVYNRSEANKSFNTVSYFDRYYFGGWDPVESLPEKGFLYVLTPSQYDGLKYKLVFQVKKVIYYPNGTLAYYLVSAE